MDIKKPSQKSAIETASYIGGAAGGAMLSEGVFSLVHDPAKDAITGSDTAKIVKRGAIIVGGTLLAAYVTGTSVLASVVKGAGAGMAVNQTVRLVADIAAKSSKAQTLATGSKAQQFLAKTIGLSCPSDFGNGQQFALQGAHRRSKRRSGMHGVEEVYIPEIMAQRVGLESIY